jgi:hypothetical protein
MAKKKKLPVFYLHIGLEKTGTTSIQDFLDLNAARFAKDGVFIPRSLGWKNHKKLAAYSFEAGSNDIAVTSNGIGPEEGDMAAFREGLETAFDEDFETSSARKLGIISSEDLSRLFKPSEVRRAVDFVRRYCDELKVVVFMRRQDLLASSRHYSLVLGGGNPTRVLPGANEPGQRYYDYHATMMPWIETVGVQNVLLQRFPENSAKEKFDSVSVFADLLGLKLTKAYKRGDHQHISYDAVNQILIQTYTGISGGYDPEGITRLMAQIAPYNDKTLAHIPSAGQAQNFYEQFAAGNAALLEALGAPEQAFSNDFSMYQAQNMRQEFQQLAIRRLLRLLTERQVI